VVASEIAALRGPIDALASSVVGTTDVLLNGERAAVRGGETNLGNLICEALLWYVQTATGVLRQNGDTPAVCLVNGGGIRCVGRGLCGWLSRWVVGSVGGWGVGRGAGVVGGVCRRMLLVAGQHWSTGT
jgi:hypothetical protein